jgi:hypothetical protein
MEGLGKLALAVLLGGCVSAAPRFNRDVQRAINRDDMRRMETDALVLYYPEGTRSNTLAIAARLEYCRRELQRQSRLSNRYTADKSVFVLPRLPLNNAFLQPTFLGNEQVGVVPQYSTSNAFLPLGIPPDPGSIGCHEMVHDQSFRQVSGFAALLRTIFGDVYSPQLGLDAWWQEGLAVYYETRLQGTGRLWAKYFDGLFAAGLQEIGSLHGGYLNAEQREVISGGPYLIGSHFIDYLARTYGERRLWAVMDEQSNALLFPFAISNDFRRAYDAPLATLIEDFEADARRRYPPRARSSGQHTLLRLGRTAAYARAANGREVMLTEGTDEPPRIVARDRDGKTLSSRRLTDIGFGRRLIAPRVAGISGLSMTPDGAHAYFVALDNGPTFMEARLVHLDVLGDELEVLQPDIGGGGGSISPDGATYYFTRPIGEAFTLASALFRLDLASGRVTQLATPEPRHYQADPVVSPDGRRLLVTEASDAGIRLAVYDAADGRRLSDVAAPPGQAFEGHWVDSEHVVLSGNDPERMQIFESDLHQQTYRRLTDAPYLASSAHASGQTLRFLNRDGWNWTLDEIAIPPRPASAPPEPEPEPAAPEAAAPEAAPEAPAPEAAAPEAAAPDTVPPSEAAPAAPAVTDAAAGSAAAASDPAAALGSVEPAQPSLDAPAPPARPSAPPLGAPTPAVPLASLEPGAPTSFAVSRRHPIDDRPPDVLSDEEYSAFDGLFVPSAWSPWFATADDGQTAAGLEVMGGDRLGWQRWVLGAGWDFDAKLPSAELSYHNGMLAPFFVRLDAAYIAHRAEALDELPIAAADPVNIKEVAGALRMGARWYDSFELSFGARVDAARYELADTGARLAELRFTGPLASVGFDSFESTPYAGKRLGVALEATGSYFPEALSSVSYDLVDTLARAQLVLPLPLSKRHTLTLSGRSRSLLGAPPGQNLLQVGGSGTDVLPAVTPGSAEDEGGAGLLPPELRFFERLRGFEDLALYGRRVLVGDATYTYPFIIDWGTASTLKLLPALFVRQVNLDLFFSTASFLEEGQEVAVATGAALELELGLWLAPVSLQLQGTRRLSHDEDIAVYFTIGSSRR